MKIFQKYSTSCKPPLLKNFYCKTMQKKEVTMKAALDQRLTDKKRYLNQLKNTVTDNYDVET